MRLSTYSVRSHLIAPFVAALIGMMVVGVASASAVSPGAGWSIASVAEPTNFQSTDEEDENVLGGGNDRFTVTAVNIGSRATHDVVTIVDKVPPGLVATLAALAETGPFGREGECSVATEVTCTFENPVPVGRALLLTIHVQIASPSDKSLAANEVTVSDGEGGEASASESTAVNMGSAPFGVNEFAFEATGSDGRPDAQSGDHPFDVTTRLAFNTVLVNVLAGEGDGVVRKARIAVQAPKDIVVELPLGFSGDPLATERCPVIDMTNTEGAIGGHLRTICPAGSRVGTVRLVWQGGGHPEPEGYPLYNLTPVHGYPAELGFNAGAGQPVFLYASVVPSPSGYRLRISSPGALNINGVEQVVVTTFGDPAEQDGTSGSAAFQTNPTRCSPAPLTAKVEMSGWEGGFATAETTAYPAIAGCGLLQEGAAFSAQIETVAEKTQADTPSGYEIDLKFPQAANTFGALAKPELKNATVTLPAGVSLSPATTSGPNALEGCTAAQIDLQGTERGNGHPGGNGSPYDDGLEHASPGRCPENSRVGTVKIKTPLLEEALEGHLFLAQPQCGGAGQPECTEAAAENGEIFKLYLEATGSGVIIKLAGSVEVGGHGSHSLANGLAPGQVRTKFLENPEMPVEDVKVTLPGGERASLVNPQGCGMATTMSDLEPWSAPESGSNTTPSSSFGVTGCSTPEALNPAFTAGTVMPEASAFSPFTLTFSRKDGEQDLLGIDVKMPRGLVGLIPQVQQCGEPQASQGTCGPGSLLGHTEVASGAGAQPLWVSGSVYLTGPYKGAPFGLSVVTPAKAGPFNLGNVITRAAIHIDPGTGEVSVVSDALPQIVDGVPLRIKTVNVTIDRPNFTFNPTNCNPMAITGTLTGAQGATAQVSSHFQVTNCAALKFAPKFSANTAGAAHPNGPGASFHVRLGAKEGPGGGEANIKRVEVQLPKLLPARLTTLQKSCTQAQFSLNPAGCPEFSFVGTATARTPVLANALTGPAILVSHGGAAFPDLVIVLQGEGIVLDLVGNTQIKNGITYSRFETVPDAPVSSFALDLPQSKHSALSSTSFSGLCGQNLVMPTFMEAQNGAQLHQNTNITIAGCGPKIAITKKKLTGNSVSVTVKTSVKGVVTITGAGLRKTTKTLGAGSHTLKVPLTANGRTARNKHHKIKIKAALKAGKKTVSKSTGLKL